MCVWSAYFSSRTLGNIAHQCMQRLNETTVNLRHGGEALHLTATNIIIKTDWNDSSLMIYTYELNSNLKTAAVTQKGHCDMTWRPNGFNNNSSTLQISCSDFYIDPFCGSNCFHNHSTLVELATIVVRVTPISGQNVVLSLLPRITYSRCLHCASASYYNKINYGNQL